MSTLDTIFNRPDTAIDPVCKMTVDMTNPPGGVAEHQGETYYFCSAGCRQAFEADPAKYLDPSNTGGHEGHDHGHEGHHH
jgi:P-type Cu+ transporter